MVRVGSTRAARAVRLAVVAVPLMAAVVVLAWPGAAPLARAGALGALGCVLLCARWWL